MPVKTYLAIDQGAESGRGMLGKFDGNHLTIQQIYRYPNSMVKVHGHYYWDVLYLYREIKKTMSICAKQHTDHLDGLGIDNWAVDFGLLDKNGELLGFPYAYRDPKNNNMFEEGFRRMPRRKIYQITGIQFLPFNTSFQMLSLRLMNSAALDSAAIFLFMADILNYFLTGIKKAEFSVASGSQLYDNNKYQWSKDIFDSFEIPFTIAPEVIDPGTVIGELLNDVKDETGIKSAKIIAPLTHDTGSAIFAVPMIEKDWACCSSGTWSIMGSIEKRPIITEQSYLYNFTNEGGMNRSVRFLKNIMGLWLIQRLKRDWEKNGDCYSYDEITEMASKAKPFKAVINPDDMSFYNPINMSEAIINFCEKTGQEKPETKGEIARIALEGLALVYRRVFNMLSEIKGKSVKGLNIVGGGSKNRLLSQMTADCLQKPVVAGPAEATAIGNILVQAMADKAIANSKECREVIGNSFDVDTFEPNLKQKKRWDETFEKFMDIATSSLLTQNLPQI
jgi:sugar (pentulose or hexulose) kinase